MVQITKLKGQGLNDSQVARELKRSRCCIQNFIKRDLDIKRNPGGRPAVLTVREVKMVQRRASNSSSSAQKIKEELNLSCSSRTVLNAIHKNPNLKYMKMMVKPRLLPRHIENRLKFAKKNMATNWKRVWFSDEKRWNLDGPDGFKYYWHDKRLPQLSKIRRQGGGNSVMIWAAFGYESKSELCFIEKTMDSDRYVDVLDEKLLPCMEYFDIFQQDNSSVHTSKTTSKWLEDNFVNVLEWPACSPDINCIENLWGHLSRTVYGDGKQYDNVYELKRAIQAAWDQVEPNYTRKLVDSMPERVYEVIKNAGGSTHY